MKKFLRQRGFGLIEVLVSMVLIAVGILGMVALQSRSIAFTQDAVQRNKAIALTADLVEIIRSNAEEILESPPTSSNVFYGEFKGSSMFFKAEGADFEPAAAACPAVAATASEQLGCWRAEAISALPGGEEVFEAHAYVCRSSTRGDCDGEGSILEIQLAWEVKPGECPDERAPDDTTCIYRTRVEL